ncbi:hypothetical protein [Sphingomonas sanxanigenens]|uniref:Tip attachment protein J domain-containing protein n=1 Tax=Sphingomonas sanxanigenens DSM 19645 = NX02 TaxID=1123269 RepID=W0ACD8_9SPHN|nr:hypothetical protein [Sphingomonas sanxanigenens]AHE55544.1 hypothetical protein NX02_19420 [Sphingomonas sanxanigenens DSM 19645 = NX02]
MSKTLRTVALIAGAVALVATGVGAAGGGAAFASTFGATTATVASVASAVATAASLGATLLAKKPGVLGSVNNITISANGPIPYSMGRSYVAGSQMYDVGYGQKSNGVKNPYRALVLIWSATTAHALEDFLVDWQPVAFAGTAAIGYYSDFLFLSKQIGLRPEPAALAGRYTPIPDWGPQHKLSGYAAGLINMRFDKKGKRWASGVPPMGMVGRWSKSYDPRKDGTFPGGSGAHRWADEETFEYDPSVGLNALAYARGRFALNGVQVVGCGFPQDSIDWPSWLAWINVCQANGWEASGTVYDGPGLSRWENLKRICQAGAALPCFSGGKLAVRFQAPKVALDTITADDLADGELVAPAMPTYRGRINSIVPLYRSEQNKWEFVQSTAVTDAGYVALDGEPKEEELKLELVADKDQAAQIGAYELVNRREISGITLPCKPRLWEYRLGECLHLDIPELGLDLLGTIVAVSKDIGSAITTLTFDTETNAKHAFALGQTGTAPPPPTLTPHGDSDDVIWNNDGNEVDNPVPAEWTVTTKLAFDSTGTLRASIAFDGEPGDQNVAAVTFDYRAVGATAWTTSATVAAQSPTRHEILGLDPDAAYEIGIRYRGSGAGADESSRLVLGPYTFNSASLAPAPATLLTATGGTGSAAIGWRNPVSSNFGHCRLYRGTTTVFADATEIAGPLVGGLGQVMAVTDTVAAGSYRYWVRAFSDAGVPAAATGPASATVA